jgi:hypothetical protein
MTFPDLRPGDHIKVDRGPYHHHGIYIGDNQVIHFTGASKRPEDALIRLDSIDNFARGGQVQVVEYAQCLPATEVLLRAHDKRGDDGYKLFANNCEHLARWCKTGHHESQQARNVAAGAVGVGGSTALGAGSIGVVAGAGTVAGLSGPGIMSGLATVGGTIGMGAIGGITVLATAPAVLTTAAMHRALKDDPCLPAQERTARKVGRWGTTAGAAAAGCGSVGLISAAGVPGLSAAGLTSGLAAIGGAVGGGMAAGVFVTVAAPAVIASFIGWGLYRLLRRTK